MTKYSLQLLLSLHDNNIDNPLEALCIRGILSNLKSGLGKSYSTTYRHLKVLIKLEYVEVGEYDDEKALTYFITEKGRLFCESQFKKVA